MFSPSTSAFGTFLDQSKNLDDLDPRGDGDARNTKFVPRNFLIEERIDSERAANYSAVIPSSGTISFSEWNRSHNRYLEERVFLKPPAGYDHRSVFTDDATVCPDTFRGQLGIGAFAGADLDLDLIRMIDIADVAWLSDGNEDDIYALGEQVVGAKSGRTQAWDELDLVLEESFLGPKCDHRPMFAAFYEDFLDELHDPSDHSWPNKLRDRLGLYHLNQWIRPLPRRVFLFRYSVRDIPRRVGEADRRPIAVPTVLDHRLSEAFCPAPLEFGQGQTLNLLENATVEPAREILHLFTPLDARHLFRVGAVTNPVPDYLGPARRDHLLWLRLLSGREDYASSTDSDLL